jgi:type VI secretion system secreted protein Hcp
MMLLRAALKAFAVVGAIAGLFFFTRADVVAIEHLTVERAAPIFMNCQNLTKGASSTKGLGWIELNSFQWGVGRGISSSTGGSADRESSTPSVSEIVVTKSVDKASPALTNSALQGKGDKCTLNFDKSDTNKNQPYLTLNLHNVFVSRYHISSGGDRPTESITLNFTKIEYKDKVQAATGGVLAPSSRVLMQPSPTPSPIPVKPK